MTPRGWGLNPSSWGQRLPLVLWSLVGFAIAAYLTLFQLNLIPSVWDPVFGGGSRTVLRSEVSTLLPIPDAALGAMGYLFDAVTGAVGGRARWRTMPWMVLLFGLAAGPLGAVGVGLVIMQPVLCGAWCLLCLISAAISVGMVAPSLDEAMASLQYLRREKTRGRSWWRAFWGGGTVEEAVAPLPAALTRGGGSAAQVMVAALGLWLTAAPEVLGYGGPARINDWFLGPLIVSAAVVSWWEFMRPVRWVNVALGTWTAGFATVFNTSAPGRMSGLVCGFLIALLALRQGTHRPALFGGGWKAVLREV